LPLNKKANSSQEHLKISQGPESNRIGIALQAIASPFRHLGKSSLRTELLKRCSVSASALSLKHAIKLWVGATIAEMSFDEKRFIENYLGGI
jgi:hypothetical protein